MCVFSLSIPVYDCSNDMNCSLPSKARFLTAQSASALRRVFGCVLVCLEEDAHFLPFDPIPHHNIPIALDMPPRRPTASQAAGSRTASSSTSRSAASSRSASTSTRRTAKSKAPSSESEDGEAADSPDQSDSEEEVISKPSRNRTKKAAPPPVKKAAPVKAARSRKQQVVESDDEDEDELAAPLPPPKAKASKSASARSTPAPQDEEEEPEVSIADESKDADAAEAQITVEEASVAESADDSDDDQSGSVDADATFVGPSRKSSANHGSSDPASGGPRFSLTTPSTPDAPRVQVPSTPGSALPPADPTRLVIHKLVLKDFKSYAGLQTIGPFHKSFSSIVGPNGSGKSNVIDALLFVFGWRANKMRQGKLGELIHSSSVAGRAKPAETKVSVVFREIVDLPGPDAYRVVPNSKLIVSRTAYQNNSSVYHLNGKKSSFTEVTTLLKEKGIDLDHKRFLILQGEVESIAQMPPKARNEHEEGLLEYLEDIIGTSRFKEDIEEAAKTVEECNEQRGERLGRLKIVQREKDSMEGKKREAESLLRDSNALTQRQSILYQLNMYECRTGIEKAKATMTSLSEQIALQREKHKDAQANVAEWESSHSKAKAEWEGLKKEVDKLNKEVEKLEKDDVQMAEKKKHFETKRKKLVKQMSEDKHHLSEARTTLASSEEDIERLQGELEKLESSLEAEETSLESIRDSLKGKTGHLSTQIEAKQRELAPWIDKVKEKEASQDVKTQEIDLIKGREEARAQDVEDARLQLREVKDELKEKKAELTSLGREKDEVADQLQEKQSEVTRLQAHHAKIEARASSARSKADDAKSTHQASASQSSVLTSLTRQADLGMIKGFHGRLGSLGVINDKYDVAISTACPGLDNIVVDTVDCGQACIEHLRKNNLGRANFILLESIANLRVEPVQTPENVPRLVDLVKPREARFLPAFYHQLRDTLVAKDLAHANRIAYGAKRWRVVTLDGQLIDKSGTMSGGGTRVAKGGMSSKFADNEYSPEQIARLQQEVVQLEGEVQASSMQLQRKEVELRDLTERPNQIEVEIAKAQMALKVGGKRLEEAQKRCEDVESQSQPDASEANRLDQLASEIQTIEADLLKLRSKTSTFEDEIAALQEKILDAGGVRLRAQQSKVDGIKEMMDLSSEKRTKAEVAKAKADKDIHKLEIAMKKHTSTLEEIEGEVNGLKDSSSEKGGVVTKARVKLEERQHAMEVMQDERDELRGKLDESSSVINAFRSLEVEIKQKLDDNSRSLSDNEKRLRHYEEKHGSLELYHIDEDDDDEEEEEEQEEADASEPREDGEQDPDNTTEIRPKDTEATTKKSKKQENSTELPVYQDEELAKMSKETLKAEIAAYEEKVSKGSGNLAILAEYRQREQEFLSRAKDLDETTRARDAAKSRHDDLRKQRLEEFMRGFGIISSKLKEMYQTITLGGNAELELVDSLDPFSEGILFSVMPPKKSWKNISNLSGGEKTLSSLALVFALHVFKPTPLYVMDEIDAALDFRNVSIVANLIKERTKNAQFVIISLRNNMFELASRLVGIYKTNGRTKSLAVENTELSQAVAEENAIARAELAASARKAAVQAKLGGSMSMSTIPQTPGGRFGAAGGGGMPPSTAVQRFQQQQQQGLPRSKSSATPLGSSLSQQNLSQGLSVRYENPHQGGTLPSTPLSGNIKRSKFAAAASQMKSPEGEDVHGLPQTPMRIPQTPRMPKSLLARTPRAPSSSRKISN